MLVFCLDQVYQTPAVLYHKPGEKAQITCFHNAGHNQMYWYRQRPGETMTLIVYTVFGGQPDYGGAAPTKYSAIKDSIYNGSLTITDLLPEDNGVYFCAVSKHSDVRSVSS
uniref:Ig-like domain-containing protein n=1 Tax=Mastacembelus armatus TaxID=205130 RepID=A0A3Q3KT74_9TELE